MGSYKPRHLKQEQSVVSSITSRRGSLAIAAAAATIVPVAMADNASAAPVSAVAPVKAVGSYNVSYGSSNYYVGLLQWRLSVRGYRVTQDGHFGPQTRAVLKSFQWRHGISATGSASDATWRALGGVPGAVSRSGSGSTPTRPVATSNIVAIAKQYTGVPYVWGGTSPRGFDCSGFTQYVYRKAGINIPRTASAQQAGAQRVSSPRPGDLIFSGFPAYHVSIFVSNGYEIAASKPGTTIRVKQIYGYKTYGRY